jgi:very-short-patch-repair endonuclease/signal recognition particle GTPase
MNPQTPNERLTATVNAWKSKLLDLSKRNRALNFKINKVSTITVIDELPTEVFRLLCKEKKSLKFSPTDAPETKGESEVLEADVLFDEDEATDSSKESENHLPLFAPYRTETLAANFTDDVLQTNSSAEKLDKSLRRIEEQARTIIEEQGVNSLFLALGMLHYKESKDSEIVFKAPLILVPVELARRSAREGFTVKMTDEEIIVNPSLIEYLQRNYAIALPEISDEENYDLQDFFGKVNEAITKQKDWKITNEIYLALFSFQKLVMYKDLEKNFGKVAAHKIFQQIINKQGDTFIGLPNEIRELSLDKYFAPEQCLQVVDADSSQLRAIATVSQNYDLVLEGPPGTGKSQTITNLIAQALSTGKSVLFVAEKMAALEVVYRRLCEVGLGEFCLELHSTKANKRSVMQDLKITLDASLQSVETTQTATERLPVVRGLLTNYTNAVHQPYGTLNISPYRAYGDLDKVLDAPKMLFHADIFQATATDLTDVLREIDDLVAAAQFVGAPAKHPWRETTKTFYSENNLDEIKFTGTQILEKLKAFSVEAEKLESILGLPRLKIFPELDTAGKVAEIIARSPGAPFEVLSSEAWNETAPPETVQIIEKGKRLVKLRKQASFAQVLSNESYQNLSSETQKLIEQGRKVNDLREAFLKVNVLSDEMYASFQHQAQRLIEKGKKIINLRERVTKNFTVSVLEQDPTDDIAFIEQKSSGFFSFLAFLDSRYRAVKKRWLSYRLPTYQSSLIEQAADMNIVAELWREQREFETQLALGQKLFGSLWQDEKSNWSALEKYTDWVSSFRHLCSENNSLPGIADIQKIEKEAVEVHFVLDRHYRSNNLPHGYLAAWEAMQKDLQATAEYFRERHNLKEQESIGAGIFGSLWEGENSNWNALEKYAVWMISFRELCSESNLHVTDLNKTINLSESLDDLLLLEKKAFEMRSALVEYQQNKGLPQNYLTLWETIEKDLLAVAEYLREKQNLEAQNSQAVQMFGSHWQREMSDWNAIENYVSWVLEFRQIFRQLGLKGNAVITATNSAPDVGFVQTLRQNALEINELLKKFCELVGWRENYFVNAEVERIFGRVEEIVNNLSHANRWASFESVRQKLERSFAKEILDWVWSEQISFADLSVAFRRAFYQKWLTQVVGERPELREFHTLTHEQRVKEFRDLDEKVLRQNRSNLVGQMRGRLQTNLQQPVIREQMLTLRSQLNRQRGLMPLRLTMKKCLNAVHSIKPCFMMSPQSVAQLLDADTAQFDLILFDEASQLPTEDAVGAIIRGKQLVVVGDPKQLPPTNFFAVASGQVNVEKDEDGLPLFDDSQSILEEVMSSGVPSSRLKWHYRSAHESLITFSNVSFYDSDLYTFPSVETDSYDSGLHFEFIAEGIYEGKGLNIAEARRVADAVVEHAKKNPQISLGIGTFNMRQQIAIQDELEQRRREDPSIESFFDRSKREPFFVKNLENIQGDERDVIFLSVTYAKAHDGKLRYNFGPLNGENGWRRMNVLVTRSKKLMRVFSSIKAEDINLAATASRGAKLLRDFLMYAEHKRLDSPVVSAINETESPFEREVFEELSKRGLSLIPQVGASGYRIDFGVLDGEAKGKFICGIECDGVSYHSSETARDRDRLRQQVLEGRGWEIHRVWSTDWFKDRSGQIERLLKLVEQSCERTKREGEQEAERQSFAESEAEQQAREFLGDLNEIEIGNIFENLEQKSYIRPTAEPYRTAQIDIGFSSQTLLDASDKQIAKVLMAIVEQEAPVHVKEIFARTASVWQTTAGSRIQARIIDVLRLMERAKLIEIRGEFVWKLDGEVKIRSRNGTNIPAERIAPEEIRELTLLILRDGHKFNKQSLINEVRTVFGFNRTGASLQQAIERVIDDLLREGLVGEGSAGIGLRN